MNRSFDWTILGQPVRAYLSDFKGDRDHERGWHGRLSVYFGEACNRALSAEYHVPSHHYKVAFNAGHDDAPLKASFNCGLFGVYLNAELPWFAKARDAIVRAWPLERQVSSYSGRDFSLAFFDHGVFWNVGADDSGWASGTPRWRSGSWHPLGHLVRQGEPEVVEEREVVVPMPERSYRAKARLERSRWGFGVFPRFLDRASHHVDVEMLAGEQVPVPGKGENSYDCDEDAVFSHSTRADTIEDGVGSVVASVLRRRRRYGGTSWKPKAWVQTAE